MFRALALSIVLTFAAGPSAALLCRTGCNPPAAAAGGCHPTASTVSTSVADHGMCHDPGLGVAAFLREDVRRGLSAPEGDQAVLAPRYHLVDTTAYDRHRHTSWPEWSLDKRPLSVLRI